MKSIFYAVVIILVGALLGNFLGKLGMIWFPSGDVHNLLATQLNTGLEPATLDLVVVNLTLGCMFKFNITGVLGILLAAIVARKVFK